MQQKTMEILVKAGNEYDVEVTGRSEYSGRGMYGKTTCAIVIKNLGDLPYLTACASVDLCTSLADEKLERFLEDIKSLSWDNMGKGYVVY